MSSRDVIIMCYLNPFTPTYYRTRIFYLKRHLCDHTYIGTYFLENKNLPTYLCYTSDFHFQRSGYTYLVLEQEYLPPSLPLINICT
jgi:hypothetical protein